MIVIFIAGASASGKSNLSDKLKEHLECLSNTCEILRMDDYFNEAPEGCDLTHYKSTTDFTKLETRDLGLLATQIIDLNNNINITKVEYSFVNCKRSQTKQLHPPEFLIVEGTFVLHFANIMPEFKSKFKELSKASIFVRQTDYDETLNRRIVRNVRERGQSEEAVRRLDQLFLKPAFLNVIEPSSQTANLQIINDRLDDLDNSIDVIIEYLETNFGMRENDKLPSNSVVHDGSDTYFLGTGDLAARRLELQNAVLLEESKKHRELFFEAAAKGDVKTLLSFLEQGAEIDAKNNYGKTALIFAATNGHKNVVELLLNRGTNVNTKSNENDTALIFASQHGHTDIVKLLLTHGADVSIKCNIGSHGALLLAARNGHTAIAELLLTYGSDANVLSNAGRTPIEVADVYEHPETARAIQNFDYRRCLTLAHDLQGMFLSGDPKVTFEQVVRQFNVLSSHGSELSAESQLDLGHFYLTPEANQPLDVAIEHFKSIPKEHPVQYKKAQSEIASLIMIHCDDDNKNEAFKEAMSYAIEADDLPLAERLYDLLIGGNGLGDATDVVRLVFKGDKLFLITKYIEQEKAFREEIRTLKAQLARVSALPSGTGFFKPVDNLGDSEALPDNLPGLLDNVV